MFKRNFPFLMILVISCFAAIPDSSAQTEAVKVIQSQDTNASGIVAELTECKRKDGVLRIKVRFRNTSANKSRLDVYGSSTKKYEMDKFYVTAGNKKYFVLKDSEEVPLMSDSFNDDIDKGGAFLWWGKFPAPPAEVKEIGITMPKVNPFEDVPISD